MNRLSKWFSISVDQAESWYVVLALSVIVIVTQAMTAILIAQSQTDLTVILDRVAHCLCGLISIILLIFFKKSWKVKYSMWMFFILFLPFYTTTWFSEIAFSQGPTYIPFYAFKLYPILLAFLVPGPYWINFVMIVLFYLEATVLWFYLDISHLPNVAIRSEPYVTILFAMVSFILLSFKYRDRKTIVELTHHQANTEAYENLTKIFLTIRDQFNTPLQSQKIIVELMKVHKLESNEIIQSLEHSVNKLSDSTQLLVRLEPQKFMFDRRLMSEKEIIVYLEKIAPKGKD